MPVSHPSVAIITLTRNRKQLLGHCLDSLVGQLAKTDEIVILDNGSTDGTKKTVDRYKKQLPIKYFYTRAIGYPELYNTAVAKSKKDIVVFLDDDCIADNFFVSNIRRAHTQARLSCVLQGATRSIPKGNIYAQIMGDHYKNWLTVNTLRDDELRVLDNKNASLPRKLFVEARGFSENMRFGSEDIDLGIRLRKKGIRIVFDPTVIAYHHERSTLGGFIAQHMRIAASEAILDRYLSSDDKISRTYQKKALLHLRSAIKREFFYVRSFQIRNALLLPCLYAALVIIRLWKYYMTAWKG